MADRFQSLTPPPEKVFAEYVPDLRTWNGQGDPPPPAFAPVLFFGLNHNGRPVALVLDADHHDGPLMPADRLPGFLGLHNHGGVNQRQDESSAARLKVAAKRVRG